MINREIIYQKLFTKIAALVSNSAGLPNGQTYLKADQALTNNQPFTYASRRLISLASVQPETQPAIFQVQSRETPTQIKRGLPTRWNLKPELWVLVWQPDMESASSPLINNILGAVESAFAPDDPTIGDCTLGGLVSHCRIEGRDIEIFEGVTTGTTGYQAICIVPIDIMTA